MNDSALMVLGAFHFDSDHKLGAHYDSLAVVCRLEMNLYFVFSFVALAKRPQQDAHDHGRPGPSSDGQQEDTRS
jgi:hypothetical protein